MSGSRPTSPARPWRAPVCWQRPSGIGCWWRSRRCTPGTTSTRTRATAPRSTWRRCASTARRRCIAAAGGCRARNRTCSASRLSCYWGRGDDGPVSAEDLEQYETEMELQLYREYRDIVSQFSYVVETERRFYLCNAVDLQVRNPDGDMYFELRMSDAWVWDMYRPARFVKNVRVVTFKDVNVEELDKPELRLPEDTQF